MPWSFQKFVTYFGDAAEHYSEEQIGAIGLLGSLSLVLEEGELALDKVPNRPLIDVIKEYEGVEGEHEVLHSVYRGQEYFLQILRRLGSFRKNDILCSVEEV